MKKSWNVEAVCKYAEHFILKNGPESLLVFAISMTAAASCRNGLSPSQQKLIDRLAILQERSRQSSVQDSVLLQWASLIKTPQYESFIKNNKDKPISRFFGGEKPGADDVGFFEETAQKLAGELLERYNKHCEYWQEHQR